MIFFHSSYLTQFQKNTKIKFFKDERQATIKFAFAESAEQFIKKYQRRIVDLSLIDVTWPRRELL